MPFVQTQDKRLEQNIQQRGSFWDNPARACRSPWNCPGLAAITRERESAHRVVASGSAVGDTSVLVAWTLKPLLAPILPAAHE